MPSALLRYRGFAHYELTNHLGNVLAVITDRKLIQAGGGFYVSDVLTLTDYYAFGQAITERTYNASAYRYGMNGQEKDTDIDANHTTALYWEYDSRIGRRWNTDPIVKEWESPYMCFGDNPIHYSDIDGADWGVKKTVKNGKTTYDITVTGAVYNNSGKPIDMESLKTKMIAQITKSYTTAGDENTQVNVNATLRVVDDLKSVKRTEHLISIESDDNYDKYAGAEGKETNGYADMGGLKMIIPRRTAEGILKDDQKYHRTIAHEFGHSGGLVHPSSSQSSTVQGVNKYDANHKSNLMYETGGNTVNSTQIGIIHQNYIDKRINQQTQFIYKTTWYYKPTNELVEPREINYGIQKTKDWSEFFGLD